MGASRYIFVALCVAGVFVSASVVGGRPPKQQHGATSGREPTTITQKGIAVEFTIAPAREAKDKSASLLEGEPVTVEFSITDTTTQTPLTGLHPAAWMDVRTGAQATEPPQCRETIQALLGASLGTRAEIDLNAYYVLALNGNASISVVDPLFGYGGSKLLGMVLLNSPGEDWVLSRDQNKLFVSMPDANQVAVVNTLTWQVITNIDVGPKPTRVGLQPDGKYVWVSSGGADVPDTESGVTVIDTDALSVAARVRTGAGQHEMAFSADDHYAFVTNREEGTVSVIDVQKLAKIKDLKTGQLPASVAFSPISQAAYVTNEGDGTVSVIDAQSHTVLARVEAEPGLGAIRFAPDGRLGFIVNPQESLVHILDASTNRVVQTADVQKVLGKRPDQIAFSDYLAYIRSQDSEHVLMIALDQVGQEGPVSLVDFTGGQNPLSKASKLSIADTIVPAPEGTAVLVANPADKMIYYYKEGMAAPMGSFQTYGHEPRAVLVVDRSLRETKPGVYTTSAQLTKKGTFDVAFFLESPRVIHCFDVAVQENPALKKGRQVALKIDPLLKERTVRVGEEVRLRVKVTDPTTHKPKVGLKDVGVLTFLAPGQWQQRHWAQSVGQGIYEVTFTPPRAGAYYVFFQCPSLGVQYKHLPYLTLQATKENGTPAALGGLRQ